jgi:acyl-CoA thioesterase-2
MPPFSNWPNESFARDILQLERTGPASARSPRQYDNTVGAVFGGQFLAQAMAAARMTVEGWPIHSCSGHFIRAGSSASPIDYEVELSRDGRAFASRRVLAVQDGKPIFDMLASFHAGEAGPAHQMDAAPDLPDPASLPWLPEYVVANADRIPAASVEIYSRPFPVEMRLLEPAVDLHLEGRPSGTRRLWFRMPSAATIDDPGAHQCLLGFMTDYWLGNGSMIRHVPPYPDRYPVTTLNHSLWIHAPARVDRWLLYSIDTPWAGEGRGLARGLIHDRAGRLIASAAQEVVLRER